MLNIKEVMQFQAIGKDDKMTKEQIEKWKTWKDSGFLKWYLIDGFCLYFISISAIVLFIVDPLIMGGGLSYFNSEEFIIHICIVIPLALLASVFQSRLKWKRINMAYDKSVK